LFTVSTQVAHLLLQLSQVSPSLSKNPCSHKQSGASLEESVQVLQLVADSHNLHLGAQVSQVNPILSHFPSGHKQLEGDLLSSLQVKHSSAEVTQVPHSRLQVLQVNPSTSYYP